MRPLALLSLLLLGSPGIALASEPDRSTNGDAQITIPVEGATCAACTLSIRRALKKLDGVKAVESAPAAKGSVVVTYQPSKVKPEQMTQAIDGLGFKAGTPVKG